MTIKTKIFTILTATTVAISAITIPVVASKLDDLYAQQQANQAKIDAKKQEIAALEAELAIIGREVASFQNAIAAINYEIRILQGRIDVTQAEYDDLIARIAALEIKIENNKDALGLTLRELYHTTHITLIERLATSNSLSSFIDKEAQLDNLSAQLTETVATIEADKATLEVSKQAAEQKLADLRVQKQEQDKKKAEQQQLLAYSQQQQNEFQSKTATANWEREQLEAAQREILKQIAISTGAGDPTKGGYPYAGRCPTFGPTDSWNMYICQCVSYTSWKVHEQFLMGRARFDMPVWGGNWSGGLKGGNAGQWYHNAGVAGIPRGQTPKVHSVGVIGGNPGHVVWVEQIGTGSRAGMVLVSEYNGASYRNYAETWYRTSSFIGFVYFNER